MALRIIISGGGTGGHIFPAIAIANALKEKQPDCEILFVGALGKMEMEKVPDAGYKIEGLPVAGLQRRFTYKNITFIAKLFQSIRKAKSILKQFKPDVVVGVGGYASGPLLYVATRNNIPALVQEQNSFPGITNKLLAKRVQRICVAYNGMEKFFPKEKIVLTGNPIRKNLLTKGVSSADAKAFFKIKSSKKTILVVGGSLGARSINEGIIAGIEQIAKRDDVHVLWQTGKVYFAQVNESVGKTANCSIFDFIANMDMAYTAADVVISRAGAISISELCATAKPVILVPSPNVAEDHQTKNAMALVKSQAALLVKDSQTKELLVSEILKLLDDEKTRSALSQNIGALAMPDAADKIALNVLELIRK